MSGASTATTAAVVGATAVTAAYVGTKLFNRNRQKPKAAIDADAAEQPPGPTPYDLPTNWTKVDLAPAEHIVFNNVGATGTANFFKGKLAAAEGHLKKRFTEVLIANPWLAGKLVSDMGTPVLVYPTTITHNTVQSLLQVDTEACNLHPGMSIEDICTEAVKYEPPFGPQVVDNPDAPLCRLALVPCRNTDGTPVDTATAPADFAVIFFMSHTAGDGYTFYEILGMLSEGQPVRALNPARKQHFSEALMEAVGSNQDPMLELHMRRATQWNEKLTVKVGKPNKVFTLLVDDDEVAKIKAQVKAEATNKGQADAFVSTNDILTSYLGKAAIARNLVMAVDFRDRVPGVDGSDAGNYANTLTFDKGVYSSPLGIRNALKALSTNAAAKAGSADPSAAPRQEVKLRTRPYPNILTVLGTKTSVITNWASTCKDFNIPGCQEVLHARLLDLKNYVPLIPYDFATIFRARKGQLAVMFISRHLTEEQCLKAMPFLRAGPLI